MSHKTYILLDRMRPTINIKLVVNKNQKQRIENRPSWAAPIKETFVDSSGKRRTARYKTESNTIWQDEQVKDEGIPANDKFKPSEYAAVKFHFGALTTEDEILQQYLESIPQFDGFQGRRTDVKATYTVYDKVGETKSRNDEGKMQAKAANYIYNEMTLNEAKEILLSLFGVSYELPSGSDEEQLQESISALIEFINETLGGAAKILADRNFDDDIQVLVGKAVNLGIISFDAIENAVSQKNAKGEWESIKAIGNEYDEATRQRYLLEYLSTKEGSLRLQDIKNQVAKAQGGGSKKNEDDTTDSSASSTQKQAPTKTTRRRK